MDLYLQGHNYKYAAEQMLLTLFPAERPVYAAGAAGGNSVTLTLKKGRHYATAVCYLRREGHSATAMVRYAMDPGRPVQDEVRLEQRIVKLAFYRAALRWGLPKPVWGSLTGVRPAKFFAGLTERDGLTPAAAERELINTHGVDPDRAGLCAAAAAAAAQVRAGLDSRDVCLYIGIPYCPTRCAYCSFVSVDAPRLLQTIPEYLSALAREMEAVAAAVRESGRRVIAVYVGGGTPTTLSALQLDTLLGDLEKQFDLSACREITVEAGRPDTVTEEKLSVLRAHRVDRVSVNPQTMSDAVLSAIGRHHTVEQVYKAVEMVKRTGALSLNMDLIAGLPGDDPDSFARTLDAVMSLEPENITVHTLALKKGSRFLTEGAALPGADAVGAMLNTARAKLTARGFAPYYIYRQKFMSGSFENVGWTLPGHENIYNICIMEELCPILSMGAGGSTKLTAPGGVVRRLMAPKYPREYMEHIEDTCAAKKEIVSFFDRPKP